MRTLEQVACIHGQINPRDFADVLDVMGRWYNNALLAVEVNNHGHACIDHLLKTHLYPNLHQWKGKAEQIRQLRARYYGWETNSWSRPLLLAAGRRAIDRRLVTIREEKLLGELSEFTRQDNGKYKATAGHDDRVMAFLIALRSREENYYPAQTRIEVSQEFNSMVGGVRVVEALDDKANTRRRISRLLKKAKPTKSWMEM